MSIFFFLYVVLHYFTLCKLGDEMKKDRRAVYTEMVIREAFLQLVKSKPIQKITVSDICALAEISRPTFYLHYEDIYALVDEIGENMLASAKLKDITEVSMDNPDELHQVTLHLIHVIEKNLQIYKICVLERGIATQLPKKITEELNGTLIKKWAESENVDTTLDKSYIVEFIQAGFNSILSCWISKDPEKRETDEQLAYIIENLLLKGLMGFALQKETAK